MVTVCFVNCQLNLYQLVSLSHMQITLWERVGSNLLTKLVLLPGVGFSAVKIQIIAINEEGWVEFKVGNITTQLRGRIPCKPYILMFATPPAGK
jgi:hypothetical protein